MKTNYYILLILLLSFSFANAQSTETSVETVTTITVSEINEDVTVVTDSISTVVNKKEEIIIDAAKVKESIARSSSDIRIFLNRERNVENIKLLFPKINKARTA